VNTIGWVGIRSQLAFAWHCARKTFNFSKRNYPTGAFRVLTFHSVTDQQMPRFEQLIAYLKDSCGIISPAEVEQRLSRPVSATACETRVPCLLTFDDGFHLDYRAAQTILNHHKITALFFICPQLISTSKRASQHEMDLFAVRIGLRHVSESLRPMSWEDAEELLYSGHTIGAHTLTHSRVTTLSEPERTHEIVNSAIMLEHRLGVRTPWFAYPYGNLESIDDAALRIIASHYRFCCSGVRGINSSATHPLAILREHIDLNAPFHLQTSLVLGAADWAYREQRRRLSALVCAAKPN